MKLVARLRSLTTLGSLLVLLGVGCSSDSAEATLDADPADGSAGSAALQLEPLDAERIDRSQNVEGSECGFPGPGAAGYGTELGDRMENFELVDCHLEEHQLAELFCKRNDAYGDYNRATFFSLGAGWCEPCKEETAALPEVYEKFHDRGFDIVQVLFQDDLSQRPSSTFCEQWVEDFDLPFLVLMDQTWEFFPPWLEDVRSATPVSILLDANANIRFKTEGQVVPNLEAEVQRVLEAPYGD